MTIKINMKLRSASTKPVPTYLILLRQHTSSIFLVKYDKPCSPKQIQIKSHLGKCYPAN